MRSIWSQNVLQNSCLEMNTVFDDDISYVCQATTSIKLLPGFNYAPCNDNDMIMTIDRYSIFPPSDGYHGGCYPDDDGVVGSLPAKFSINNMGAAVYSVDIDLPPGINNMVPNLSFTYNNQSGNGIMGWAWNLTGLSSITRVPKTDYHDGEVSDINFVDDRFSLDGQRLIAVDGGAYGGDQTVYKTEIDNMDKIISYSDSNNGPSYFLLWKNDGTIWEYGASQDSKLETNDSEDVIIKWMLNKISDRDGNSIIFNYDKNIQEGEIYIDNIEYTLNDVIDVPPAYKVVFQYDTERKDPTISYVNGNKVSCKRLLTNVLVLNDAENQLFNYSLKYDEPAHYENNYFLHYRLKSIGLEVGDEKINPTRILWNDKNKHYPSQQYDFQLFKQDESVFVNVPFIGDFNGDGFSDVLTVPYKTQDTYPDDIVGEVYLNKGDGSFQTKPMTSLPFDKNLDWIFVMDLNGDGKDDVLSYEYNYNYNYRQYADNYKVRLKIYLMQNGAFVNKKTYTFDDDIVIVPGNFISNQRCGVLILDSYGKDEIDRNHADYIFCKGDDVVNIPVNDSYAINGKNINAFAIDMTGDGISELLSLRKDDYVAYKIIQEENENALKITTFFSGKNLVKDDFIFPNDFNGDGKIDLLYYSYRDSWNIMFSKGNGFNSPVSCANTNLLRYTRLNAKDRYKYSLKELDEPSVAIRTADFDGDGTSDVGVFRNSAGNYYLEIGFMPVDDGDKCNFTYTRRYYMPINYSHQNIFIGKFLAQENISVLSTLSPDHYYLEKPYITSLYPNSAYYSVERIIDGMGNIHGFCYDYLMQRIDDVDCFYTFDNQFINEDVRTSALPLLALKSDTVFNINNKPIVTEYCYHNALFHPKGHGFLAFEKITKRNFVNGSIVQKQIQEFEVSSMGNHFVALPYRMSVFYGENQLVKELLFDYKKYSNKDNKLIFMPLLDKTYELDYNLDNPDEVIKCIIKDNVYESDNKSYDTYDDVVLLVETTSGYSSDIVSSIKDCEFYESQITYYYNDMENWIVKRPSLIVKYYGSDKESEVGAMEYFYYNDDANPLRVSERLKIPNIYNDHSDSLQISIEYEYDKIGNIVQQSMSSPSMKNTKVLKRIYGDKYGYRFATSTIDEMGNEIICDYDEDYGIMISTKDYNDYVVKISSDPLGVNNFMTMSDDVNHVNVTRWATNHDYAPDNATYYYWEKNTGQAEKLSFFHKSGAELRTLTFDLKGKPLMIDKYYDDFGNIIKQTLPYYHGDDVSFVSYEYDNYNRLISTHYHNGKIVENHYDGNKTTIVEISNEGDKKIVENTVNVMGWPTNTIDAGGNLIYYEYYSDGLLKSSQIGDDVNTKILISYDNNRNKNSMYDPNNGLVKYENDAVGNIVKVITSKNNVSEYQYDVLGRIINRKDVDLENNKTIVTNWIYSEQKGEKGILKRVYSSDNHEVEYHYDDKLKMVSSIEKIDGEEYETSYTYDKANRISTITYPTGFSLLKTYSNTGYEQAYYDNNCNQLLWMTNETDAMGNIREYLVGNGLKTSRVFNPKTLMLESIVTSKDKRIYQDLGYEYDDFGNLLSRSKKTGTYKKETFEYDDFDRVVKISLDDVVMCEMLYDDLGNILEKKINDTRVIYNATYDNNKPYHLIEAKTDAENLFGGADQKVVYSIFDNIVELSDDEKILSIEYGCDYKRKKMHYDNESGYVSKVYVGDCEFVDNNGVMSRLTYIKGPLGVFAVSVIDDEGNSSINYIHKDNLDSWNLITDEYGDVLQETSFDAWGNMRDPDTWMIEPDNKVLMYDRGFTGHEHLLDFGLINMNGRVYDPLLSMMLSPDNNIQVPQMSQNFNRYSYCLNNPLKYNDPTGEWVESLIFGVVGGASNVLFNASDIDNFAEGALLFGVGFAKGFLTEITMGQSWFLQVGVGALAEGLKMGVNEFVAISDGSFNLSGDDWNAVTKSLSYGIGSGLMECVLTTSFYEPTEEDYGTCIRDLFFASEELGHVVTSFLSHSVGCWFSVQPTIRTIKLNNLGFDLEMMGYIAARFLRSYVSKSDFAEQTILEREREIKESIMNDVLAEDPDHPDIDMYHYLTYVEVDYGRIYIAADIFASLPGTVLDYYLKPYLEEVMSFPFSFSLFRSLFFNNDK